MKLKTHTYFKEPFRDIFCKSVMVFQKSLMLRKSSELADKHSLKQDQIISRCLLLKASSDVGILEPTALPDTNVGQTFYGFYLNYFHFQFLE